jgi:hypothetical protein
VYTALGPFSGAQAASTYQDFISKRTAEGWALQPLNRGPIPATAQYGTNGDAFQIFSPDLSRALGIDYLPEGNATEYYLWENGTNSAPLFETLPTNVVNAEGVPLSSATVGMSPDLLHLILRQEGELYEWSGGHETIVSVLPDGTPVPSTDTLRFVGLSADGSRVFWIVEAGSTNTLYVRENDSKTVTVASLGSGFETEEKVRSISPDGSKVFLATDGEHSGGDLYEYSLTGETVASTDMDPGARWNYGTTIVANGDGSYVYFFDASDNLDLWHGGVLTRVASGLHLGNHVGTNAGESGDEEDQEDGRAQMQVTPDGKHLTFLSVVSLTGYDNTIASGASSCGHIPGAFAETEILGPACTEVFEYSADTNHVTCVSCNPSGARPLGLSTLPLGLWQSAVAQYVPRNLSEDGSRVFFETQDALVTSDSNHAKDIYEYEAGRPHLITTGRTAPSPVGGHGEYGLLMGTSASGNDAFFLTADQLAPQDGDFLLDIYDARVDGGFASPVGPVVCESTDGCRAPVSPAPSVFGVPSSQTFSGLGNQLPTGTVNAKAKPKQRRNGKKRRRHARKGPHRKGSAKRAHRRAKARKASKPGQRRSK